MDRQPVTTPPQPQPRPWWATVRLIINLIIVILLINFIIINYHDVKVHFVFWTATIQLAWALLIAAVLGAIAGWLLRHSWRRR